MNGLNMICQFGLATLLGTICLVVIIVRGKDAFKFNSVRTASLLFVINLIVISILLYTLFSLETFLDVPYVPISLRVLDYFSYAFLLYSWLNLLQAAALSFRPKFDISWFALGKMFSLFSVAVFLFIAIFLMKSPYHIPNENAQAFYHVFEIIFSLCSVALLIICMFKIIKISMETVILRYIVTVTSVLIMYFLSQIALTAKIGSSKSFIWGESAIDFTGWLLSIICIFTCILLKKSLFATPIEDGSFMAEYSLTSREREIACLICDGKTNAEIASELCISVHTVKTHLKNIFSKMNVSSRAELMSKIIKGCCSK